MNKILNIIMALCLLTIVSGCSKEHEFEETGYGKVNTRSLTVELINETETRAGDGVALADFKVEFFKKGSTEAAATYRYGDMPEVVELPVGTYTATATYGENPSAAWESPYYKGETLTDFEVKADQVTIVNDPIVCSLSNVKVTVYFSEELTAAMSADSKVSVKVGEHGTSLEFGKSDEGKAGYFAYVADSRTLAATFIGEVQGYSTTETKVYDDVNPGNHYKILFKLHTPDEEPGDISGTLHVDATVAIENVNRTITDDNETILVDDMRPGEDPKDDPKDPSENSAPTIVGVAPINLDGVNEVTGSSTVKVNVKSTAPEGIQEFKVEIISENLTKDELEGMGLSTHLDLVNPGDLLDPLQGLGFLKEGQTSLKGEKDLEFDISSFMTPLSIFGPNTHKFKFTVSDSYGTTEKTLILKVIE